MANSEYPDPETATYSTPYPSSVHHAVGGPYGDPSTGGLWQGPSIALSHEGADDSQAESDDEDDPDQDLRRLYTQYDMNSLLRQGAPIDAETDQDDDMDDYSDAEELGLPGLDDDQATSSTAVQAGTELQDPSDGEESGDSIDSILLARIIGNRSSQVGRGRGRGPGRPRGSRGSRGEGGTTRAEAKGKRGWKWALKGTEHDPKLKKQKSNRLAKRPRGRPKGSVQKQADPGEAFKRQQALATERYVAGDLEAAADLARAAVRANPEVFAAHSLLSEILLAQGRDKDSLTVLLAGAHTKRDPELWHQVGHRTLELAGADRSPENLDAAIYCFSWAIKIDRQDLEARRQRLNLLLESYQITASPHTAARARNECKAMLRLRPNDALVAREYAELSAISGVGSDIKQAKEAYDEVLGLYSDGAILGPDPDEEEQWSHALAYSDLVNHIDGTEAAIQSLKDLARWIQQRRDQTFWDEFPEDDREFDSDGSARLNEVSQYIALKAVGSVKSGADLPMDARVRFGLHRLGMGEKARDEALHHFSFLEAQASHIADLADLFRDVADALMQRLLFSEALKYFEPLQNVPQVLDTPYYLDLATCYLRSSQTNDARDCFLIVANNDKSDWRSRIELAKIYDSQGRRSEAVPLIQDVIDMGRSDVVRQSQLHGVVNELRRQRRSRAFIEVPELREDDDYVDDEAHGLDSDGDAEPRRTKRKYNKSGGTTAKRSRGVTAAGIERSRNLTEEMSKIQSAYDRVRSSFSIVEACEEGIEADDDDTIALWKTAVEGMLDEYKANRYLCPADRSQRFTGYGRTTKVLLEAGNERSLPEESESPSRDLSSLSIPDEFCDIKFSIWLDLFCSYALQAAREGSREAAYSKLETATHSNVFKYHQPYQLQVQVTLLACALLLNDEEQLTTVSRSLIMIYPTSVTPYQIFECVHRLFVGRRNWYNAGPTQKFMLRAVKAFDFGALAPEDRETWGFTKAEQANMANKRTATEWAKIKEIQPSVLTMYGHILAAAQTWNAALNYYFRALAMRPDDPVLLLCIGLAYVQNSMKRQVQNRHWNIMTALGFLEDYKQVRKSMAESSGRKVYEQEAEYNIARAWHFLGLGHLAAKGYRRCLRIRDQMGEEKAKDGAEIEEYTQEAALALVNIYVLTGQTTRAREVTEKYMVL